MIIGIMGQAGSGKDTFADRLVDKYGFVKLALADPLKRICKDIFDFSDKQLWGPSEERNKPDPRYLVKTDVSYTNGTQVPIYTGDYLSPRVALQTLGTEWGRVCYKNVWVDYALRSAKKILSGDYGYSQKRGLWPRFIFKRAPSGVVIPDVRFKNELDAIRSYGGNVIRLNRENIPTEVGVKNHASEQEQKSISDDQTDLLLIVREGIDLYHKDIDSLMREISLR